MDGLFTFLQGNPYILLFLTVGLSVFVGRVTVKGYGLGMVAGAIVVGAALSSSTIYLCMVSACGSDRHLSIV